MGLWNWDIAGKVWWAQLAKPWLSLLCLPPNPTWGCWAAPHSAAIPPLRCVLRPHRHLLGATKWALIYLLCLVCTSATSQLGTASQKTALLYFLPLLCNLSMSGCEPKMTCEGLSFISLNSLCVSHISSPANSFELAYSKETKAPADGLVSRWNSANNELFSWVLWRAHSF